MEFAVKVNGLDEQKGRWVMAVDAAGERLLVAHDDASLHWYPLADCTLFRVATPDQPRLVMLVQPALKDGIVRPNMALMKGKGLPLS